MSDILTITISSGTTGLLYATCDEHRGLIVARRTLTEVLNDIPNAIGEMISAGAKFPTLDGIAFRLAGKTLAQ